MRKPRAYIASSLENAMQVELLRNEFITAGWEITHDWTTHGSVQAEGEARIREVAMLEVQGVLTADAMVVLLPGARGTHVELGVAIATRTPTLIVGDTWQNGRQCAFYFAPRVWRMDAPPGGDMRAVVAVAAGILPKHLQEAAGLRRAG